MFLFVKRSGQNNIVHHQTFYMIKKWSFISWRGSCQLKLDEIYQKSSIKNIIKHALSHRPQEVISMMFCHQVRKHKKSQTQQQKTCVFLWCLSLFVVFDLVTVLTCLKSPAALALSLHSPVRWSFQILYRWMHPKNTTRGLPLFPP